ncbi:MAG TPA: hypothetical protein VFM14_06550 [Gemmatimonadales bacterium]|nr:hypothetical protein [Gemmatimonadales bacterium]
MRSYVLAAAMAALLAGCGDPTGPDLAAAAGTGAVVAKPNMDPVSLTNGR